MKQMTFSDVEYSGRKRNTQKEKFLNEMDAIIPWSSWVAMMGYCLPAAIGVCIANNIRKIYLVTREGSLQMNIQELQTIVHNRLPITIFIMNNQGYHSIRVTQRIFFKEPLVGVGSDSGDLSFPDLAKLALAYELPYRRCEKMEDMNSSIIWAMNQEEACICEMMLSTNQITEPKAASRRLPGGSMISAPLEDMAPFLPAEEIKKNMYIPYVYMGGYRRSEGNSMQQQTRDCICGGIAA